jgi:hypothetical protein
MRPMKPLASANGASSPCGRIVPRGLRVAVGDSSIESLRSTLLNLKAVGGVSRHLGGTAWGHHRRTNQREANAPNIYRGCSLSSSRSFTISLGSRCVSVSTAACCITRDRLDPTPTRCLRSANACDQLGRTWRARDPHPSKQGRGSHSCLEAGAVLGVGGVHSTVQTTRQQNWWGGKGPWLGVRLDGPRGRRLA